MLVHHRAAVQKIQQVATDAGMISMVVKTEVSRFGRTPGTVLRNGVSPLSALLITQETIPILRCARRWLVSSRARKKEKASPSHCSRPVCADACRQSHPRRRGDGAARRYAADIYEPEARRGVDRLLALLVRAVTIGLGIVVALVIGSILTAIHSVCDLAF
jgi:general secretion pathway protein F